jgi:gamma-glutamyltranspeptidase/glutathione hydrolase/leukotriene-C4 hydrolase
MGVAILRDKNGTAVDAAVTTTLCIGLLNGFSSGLGGGGFALVSLPEGRSAPVEHPDWEAHPEFESDSASSSDPDSARVLAIDFRETAPAASDAHMYAKTGRAASQVGGLAVSVPGELRGLEAAYKLYGTVPWSELVEPIVKLARGWQVSRELARRIRIYGAFMLEDPVWAEVYAPRGALLVEGEWVKRERYADTLEIVARQGPGALYSGEIADDIVDTVRKHGGILTHQDLADYRARVYPAVKGDFAGQTIYTADAPASGGVMLGMLQILDPMVDQEACWSESSAHNLVEAMKFAFGARSEVTDPKFAKNLTRLAEFRTKAWADSKRALVTDTTHGPDYYGLNTESLNDSGTTHLSIIDQWGGAASVTSTVNLIWGSHLMTPKTGIILNDEQDDFAVPGQPDAFGLPPSPWNYPAPGKRPLSSTAPTVVHTPDGQIKAVLGGSGGSRIFPSVAQVLVNMACGDGLSAAIERPRLHDQVLPKLTTLEVGPDGVDNEWVAALEKRGHKIGQFDINVGAAEVQGVIIDKHGKVWASSDSRKNGIADVY